MYMARVSNHNTEKKDLQPVHGVEAQGVARDVEGPQGGVALEHRGDVAHALRFGFCVWWWWQVRGGGLLCFGGSAYTSRSRHASSQQQRRKPDLGGEIVARERQGHHGVILLEALAHLLHAVVVQARVAHVLFVGVSCMCMSWGLAVYTHNTFVCLGSKANHPLPPTPSQPKPQRKRKNKRTHQRLDGRVAGQHLVEHAGIRVPVSRRRLHVGNPRSGQVHSPGVIVMGGGVCGFWGLRWGRRVRAHGDMYTNMGTPHHSINPNPPDVRVPVQDPCQGQEIPLAEAAGRVHDVPLAAEGDDDGGVHLHPVLGAVADVQLRVVLVVVSG